MPGALPAQPPQKVMLRTFISSQQYEKKRPYLYGVIKSPKTKWKKGKIETTYNVKHSPSLVEIAVLGRQVHGRLLAPVLGLGARSVQIGGNLVLLEVPDLDAVELNLHGNNFVVVVEPLVESAGLSHGTSAPVLVVARHVMAVRIEFTRSWEHAIDCALLARVERVRVCRLPIDIF